MKHNLTPKDKSISITFGLNNFGFWKEKFGTRYVRRNGYFHFSIIAGWVTLWISSPSLYHLNAITLNKLDELKK